MSPKIKSESFKDGLSQSNSLLKNLKCNKGKRKYSSSSSSSSTSSSSSSLSDSDDKVQKLSHLKNKKKKKKTKKKLRKLKKLYKREKKIKSLAKKLKKHKKENLVMDEQSKESLEVPEAVEDDQTFSEENIKASKAKAPMTKEEWEKQQSIVRRVYDPETQRHRLIKGTGEVLEECVSRERHLAINKAATKGDGEHFQAVLKSKIKL